MKASFFLLGIIFSAASGEQSFKTGSAYVYEVNSKTLTSLFQVTNQNAGVFTRAQLTITPVKEDELVCVISKPEVAYIHTTFPENVDFDTFRISTEYKPWNLSKEPFIIKLKEGIIDELIVSKELPIWEVNIIRSIVSQFQIDTRGKRVIPSKLNSIPREDENTAVYKIMEDTVEGDCEVLYDITPLPKHSFQDEHYLPRLSEVSQDNQLIEIMKTKNFSNCEHRPGYHFGITGLTDWEPTANRMGNFLTRLSVSRVILSGNLESYTIQSSRTSNKIILSPTIVDQRKGNVFSCVDVALTSIQSASKTIQKPKNSQVLKKLVYDFNSPFTSDREAREKWEKRKQQTVYKAVSSGEAIERQDKKKEQTSNKTLWSFGSTLEQFSKKRSIDDKTMILSNEGWYQEMPQMAQAPSTPFFPYFIGYFGHSIHHHKKINVNQVVRRLVEQIGQHMQDQIQAYDENFLEKFTILINLLRTMNTKQLDQCVQEIYVSKENVSSNSHIRRNAWMTFRDALAQAGTGPALMAIVNLINSHKIKGEEAAQIISTLPKTARYPTTEYLNTFFELIKNTNVLSQSNLNSSCIFAFTELIRMAQVNPKTAHNHYAVHAFGYFASQDDLTVPNVYIPYFANHLEKAVAKGDSHKIQTYIMALGNIAHPKIVQVFEPYLEGKSPMTDHQRSLLVFSLNKLAIVHPRLARSILYKIYANTGEVYSVRVAAVFTLMKANPPGNMLQRMAQFTHEDPSYQVRSAVRSAIISAAQLSSVNNELRKNAESAVHLLISTVYGSEYSQLNITDYIVNELFLDYTQTIERVGSEDSSFPKSVIFKVLEAQSGFKHSLYEVSGMVSSVQRVLNLLRDIFNFHQNKNPVTYQNPDNLGFTIDKIIKTLNIESMKKEQIEGNAFFKFGTIQRFFAFDNRTLNFLPGVLEKVTQILSKGNTLNYQKLFSDFELCIGLPLASGLQFTYTLTTPVYVGFKGKVKLNISEGKTTQKIFQIPKIVQLFTDVDITFAKTTQGELGFVTPFDHQRYVAGYKKEFQINIPVKGSLYLDTSTSFFEITVKPDEKSPNYKFFHYSTKPFTGIQSVIDFKPILESNNSIITSSNFLKKNSKLYWAKNLGMVFRLETLSEKKLIHVREMIYNLIQNHVINGKYFSIEHNGIEDNEVGLYYDKINSDGRIFTLGVSYRNIKSQEYHHEREFETHFQLNQNQTRMETFYSQAFTEIKKAVVSQLDVDLKVQGEIPILHTATVAVAGSSVDLRTKIFVHVNRTINNENSELCFYGEREDTYFPTLNYNKIINIEPTSNITATLEFGEKCETGMKIDLLGKGERTQKRLEYFRKSQLQHYYEEPQEISEFVIEPKKIIDAVLMDKYRFTIQHHSVPENIKDDVYNIFNVLRNTGCSYITEHVPALSECQKDTIELEVNLSSDLKTINALLTTMKKTVIARDIPISEFVKNMLLAHTISKTFQKSGWFYLQQHKAQCTITKTQAKTFNNKIYKLQLENVWHVMSVAIPLDNSTKFSQFSVLVRNTSNSQKEVQFNFGYPKSARVRISPAENNPPDLFINEKKINFDNTGYYEYYDPSANIIIQSFLDPTGELKIIRTGHGIEFTYDNDTVQLVLTEEYKNRIRGLCGVFDGEHFDYVTPRGYILRNAEEFVASWALSNEGSIRELKEKAKDHSLYKKTILTNVVSEQDTGKADTLGRYHEDLSQNYDPYSLGSEESTEPDSECTTKRIMVIEREGKHCFSVNPQTACKTGCQVEKTRTMNAEFICMNKSQTSSHWAYMVARGAQPNLKKKGNSQKMQYEGPEICSKALSI